MIPLISYIVVVTVIYSMYLEFGPGLGGMWIRNKTGNGFFNVLNVFNLLQMMFRPLWDIRMWNKRFLDINWIFVLSVALILFTLIRRYAFGPRRLTILAPGASIFERIIHAL